MSGRDVTCAALIGAISLCRVAFFRALPKRVLSALWTAAALFLLLPVRLPSRLSIYALLPAAEGGAQAAMPAGQAGAFIPAVCAALGLALLLLYGAGLLRLHCMAGAENDPRVRIFLAQHPLARPLRIVRGRVRTPLCGGILLPVIALSEEALSCGPEELACVLTHEYLHVCRFDPLRKLLFSACVCMNWWNPMAWLMPVLAGRDLEYACDEAVLGCGFRPQEYGAALLRMELLRGERLPLTAPFLSSGTERRVRRILRHRPHGAGAWLAAAALAAGILLVFATAPAALPAQAAPEALRADPLPQQSMAVHAAPQTGSPALQPALYDAPDPYCDFVLLDRRSHVELLAMEGVMRELQETYHARFVRVTMESEARGCVSIYRPPVR